MSRRQLLVYLSWLPKGLLQLRNSAIDCGIDANCPLYRSSPLETGLAVYSVLVSSPFRTNQSLNTSDTMWWHQHEWLCVSLMNFTLQQPNADSLSVSSVWPACRCRRA